jgi:hypothetical protein
MRSDRRDDLGHSGYVFVYTSHSGAQDHLQPWGIILGDEEKKQNKLALN